MLRGFKEVRMTKKGIHTQKKKRKQDCFNDIFNLPELNNSSKRGLTPKGNI